MTDADEIISRMLNVVAQAHEDDDSVEEFHLHKKQYDTVMYYSRHVPLQRKKDDNKPVTLCGKPVVRCSVNKAITESGETYTF